MLQNAFVVHALVLAALCFQANSGSQSKRTELTGNTFKPVLARLNANLDALHAASLGPGDTGYNVDDVNTVLSQARDDMAARIPSDDVPLRKYVDERIPSKIESTVPQVDKRYADSIFDQLKKLLSSLTSIPSLTLNLQVNSSPSHALFDLVPPSGRHMSTTTNSSITNIYRGEYQYVVTKAGFKTVTFTINFIDRTGSTLDCDLIASSLTQSALPCTLR